MNIRNQERASKRHEPQPALQLRVRTGLRSGSELDECLAKLEDYKTYYAELRSKAKQRGLL